MDQPRGAAPGVGPGGGGWAARLERWAAEARVDAAAEARARERSLRRQAEEEATLAGVLVDLAEAGATVVVHVRGGDRYAGTIRAVGHDVVAVESGDARGWGSGLSLVALGAVTSVRTRAGSPPVTGDRPVVSALRLADVVAALAAEREAVQVDTADGETLAGEARWAGQDVLLLRTGARGAATQGFDALAAAVYVPVSAIVAVRV